MTLVVPEELRPTVLAWTRVLLADTWMPWLLLPAIRLLMMVLDAAATLTPAPLLASRAVPARLVPMKLSATTLPGPPASWTPLLALPEMTLRAAALLPPTVLPKAEVSMATP